MGRRIATTIKNTKTPMTKIMMGSRSDVNRVMTRSTSPS
jgi:hypothetical protein